MKLTSACKDGITTVQIEGKLDSAASDEAQEKLNTMLCTGLKMLMNLEKLEFISSIGLRLILMKAKEIKKGGGELRICSLKPAVKDVFTISGFNQILNIFDSQDDALKGF